MNYHFGGIERLFSSAFALGATRTAEWLAMQRPHLRQLPRSADGAAQALHHIVIEWTSTVRRLALLYQERLAAPPDCGTAVDWTALWRDFWLETAAAFGLGEREGRMMHLFFESEGLYHLSRWEPALERAVLAEQVDHFAHVWLGAPHRTPMGALVQAEHSVALLEDVEMTPSASRIAQAAAEVAEAGLGALTHRAVATQVGMTTGAVTRYFRTTEELLAGAIRGQVIAITAADGLTSSSSPRDRREFFAAVRRHAVARPLSFSRRNLFLATVRRPELAGCGAVIRFANGRNTRGGFERVLAPPPEELSLYSSALSRLSGVLRLATRADPSPEESRNIVFEAIEAGISRALSAAAA